MLTSIRQVHEEFFKVFYRTKVNVNGSLKDIPCRYARKSSYDYSEEQSNQVYPCIVIQDYTPELKEEWYVDVRPYFGGLSSDCLKGFLYNRPVWMSFRYDVSIVSKSFTEFLAMQDHFLQNFVCKVGFLFNKRLTGENAVGDVVPYKVRETDIPRTDGVHEKNYEFTLSAWIYPQTPQEVELVQDIVLTLIRVSPDMESDHVTEDGKVVITADEKEFSNVFKSQFTADEIETILKTTVVSEDVDTIRTIDKYEEGGEYDPRTLYVVKEE